MLIWEFPPELMRQVMEMAGAVSVLRLWTSGDSKLRQLLGYQGGVRTMHLVDYFPVSTSRWPMMLSELRGLEVLKIDRQFWPLCCPFLVHEQLQKLKQLRILHLTCSDSWHILFGVQETTFNENLTKFFPKLKELLISQLKEGVVLSFPSSLIHLHVTGRFPAPTMWPNMIQPQNLPANIETFELLDMTFMPSQLPSYLTTLIIPLCDASYWPKLPTTLTALDTTIKSVEDFENGFALPLSLTSLVLLGPNACLPACFRHLTKLRTLSIHTSGQIPIPLKPTEITDFGPFPASLTSLSVHWPYEETCPLIVPSKLTKLSVGWLYSSKGELRTENLKNFPSSVQQWRDWTPPALESHSHIGLPSTLRHFEEGCAIAKRREQKFCGDPVWASSLPTQTLTVLDAPNFEVNDEIATMLPICPNLHTVKLLLSNIAALPDIITQAPILQELYLSFTQVPALGIWRGLPRGIESLEIRIIGEAMGLLSQWSHPFEGLPTRYLHSLHILNAHSKFLARSDLVELSKVENLKNLIVDFSFGKTVQDHDMALIPRGITQLSFKGPNPIPDTQYQYLPPHLKILEFSWLHARDQAILQLPRSLISLKVPGKVSGVTPACIKFMPARLMATSLFPTMVATIPNPHQFPDSRLRIGNPTPLYGSQLDAYLKEKETSTCAVS